MQALIARFGVASNKIIIFNNVGYQCQMRMAIINAYYFYIAKYNDFMRHRFTNKPCTSLQATR